MASQLLLLIFASLAFGTMATKTNGALAIYSYNNPFCYGEPINAYANTVEFDDSGVCYRGTDVVSAQKRKCNDGVLEWKIWDGTQCKGKPAYQYTSDVCYPDKEMSFKYLCSIALGSTAENEKNDSNDAIVGVVVVGLVLIIALIMIVCHLRRNKQIKLVNNEKNAQSKSTDRLLVDEL